MSFRFHSPVHALLPVTHICDERLAVGGASCGCIACIRREREWGADAAAVGKTYSGGTFSPKVRASFAMRFLRTSAAEGRRGKSAQVGVTGSCVEATTKGEVGMRLSSGSTGTVFTRRTSGRGASAARRGFDENDLASFDGIA